MRCGKRCSTPKLPFSLISYKTSKIKAQISIEWAILVNRAWYYEQCMCDSGSSLSLSVLRGRVCCQRIRFHVLLGCKRHKETYEQTARRRANDTGYSAALVILCGMFCGFQCLVLMSVNTFVEASGFRTCKNSVYTFEWKGLRKEEVTLRHMKPDR